MDHIGIDVHKKHSQICILNEDGELIERRIRTEAEQFAEVLGPRPRAHIVIEAATESEWVARCLEALGHQVIVADPNFAPMYAQRSRKVKTDRRDARALAEAAVLGADRPAHRLSDDQRHVRGRLTVRDALVRTRTGYIAVIRSLLRQHGYRVRSGGADAFITRVRALPLPGRLLSEIGPLLAVMRQINQQVAYSDERIEAVSTTDHRVRLLRTVHHQSGPQPSATAAGTGRGVDPAAARPADGGPARVGDGDCRPPREEGGGGGPGPALGRDPLCAAARRDALRATTAEALPPGGRLDAGPGVTMKDRPAPR
jgi:transposase